MLTSNKSNVKPELNGESLPLLLFPQSTVNDKLSISAGRNVPTGIPLALMKTIETSSSYSPSDQLKVI